MADTSRWVVIYPVYINSKKTLAEGRRIVSSKAVENPSSAEIYQCCHHLNFSCVDEVDKAYSRDFMQRGRVRVQIKREDGSFVNPLIPTRKALMLKVAELLPKLTTRIKKHEQAATTSGSSAPTGKSGKSSKKKK